MAQLARKFLAPEATRAGSVPLPQIRHPRESRSEGAERGWGPQDRPRKAARRPARGSRRPARKAIRGSGSRTQVRTRLRRPARRPGQCPGDSLEPPGQAKRSPTQAVEADRMWKAPGHRPPAPGPSHNRWKSRRHPPPGIPTATHSLGDEGREKKKRKKKAANCHFSMHRAPGGSGTTTLPATRASSGRRGTTTHPPTRSRSTRRGMTSLPPAALTHMPPRELRPPWDDAPSAHPHEIPPAG